MTLGGSVAGLSSTILCLLKKLISSPLGTGGRRRFEPPPEPRRKRTLSRDMCDSNDVTDAVSSDRVTKLSVLWPLSPLSFRVTFGSFRLFLESVFLGGRFGVFLSAALSIPGGECGQTNPSIVVNLAIRTSSGCTRCRAEDRKRLASSKSSSSSMSSVESNGSWSLTSLRTPCSSKSDWELFK